jgi:hypothetical protein
LGQPKSGLGHAQDVPPPIAHILREKGSEGSVSHVRVPAAHIHESGHSIAFFDRKVADLRHCALFEIADLKLDPREFANPYVIVEKPPKPD